MAASRDYPGLERKLARGKTLEQASLETGIPLEEAKAYIEKRRESAKETEDDALLLFSNEALQTALKTLKRAANDQERMSSEGFGEGRYTSYATTDVEAAKALLKAGLDARRMLEKKKSSAKLGPMAQGIVDLFDATSPWSFKKPE